MADALHLRIISPATMVVDDYVPTAELPGSEGDFGVLPGHEACFAMLRAGVINVQFADGIHRRFFAASGYAEVTATACTVISDHVQDLADISMAEAQEALTAARAAVEHTQTPAARCQAEKLVQSAEALVHALAA
jgi:F-type H+-transporting ATPase subunit epsilon